MFYDLHIEDTLNNIHYKKLLHKKKYSLGRSIENDFVFLDGEIPLYWKKIRKNKNVYCVETLKPEAVDNRFIVKIIFSRFLYTFSIVLSLCLAFFAHQTLVSNKSEKSVSQPIFLPIRSARGVISDHHIEKYFLKFYFKHSINQKNNYLQLCFSAGNILDTDKLIVYINNKRIGNVDPSRTGWGHEYRLHIPNALIQQDNNTVIFALDRQDTTEKKWGVRNIYVEHSIHQETDDLKKSALIKYLEAFLKIPQPDEYDFKRAVSRIKKHDYLNFEIQNGKHDELISLFKQIKKKQKKFLKAESLKVIRGDQLGKSIEYEQEVF